MMTSSFPPLDRHDPRNGYGGERLSLFRSTTRGRESRFRASVQGGESRLGVAVPGRQGMTRHSYGFTDGRAGRKALAHEPAGPVPAQTMSGREGDRPTPGAHYKKPPGHYRCG